MATRARITYAQEQEWYDYNVGTTSGNATANQVVLNQVLRGFSYVDNKGEIQRDTDFGSFEKVSDSPLTVKYTFNDKAVWSDGTPIDCADFLLAWASGSGRYNKDGTVNEPNAVPAEPAYLFDTASTSGLDQTQKPTCADGDKSVTLVYDDPVRGLAGRHRHVRRIEPDAGPCRCQGRRYRHRRPDQGHRDRRCRHTRQGR